MASSDVLKWQAVFDSLFPDGAVVSVEERVSSTGDEEEDWETIRTIITPRVVCSGMADGDTPFLMAWDPELPPIAFPVSPGDEFQRAADETVWYRTSKGTDARFFISSRVPDQLKPELRSFWGSAPLVP